MKTRFKLWKQRTMWKPTKCSWICIRSILSYFLKNVVLVFYHCVVQQRIFINTWKSLMHNRCDWFRPTALGHCSISTFYKWLSSFQSYKLIIIAQNFKLLPLSLPCSLSFSFFLLSFPLSTFLPFIQQRVQVRK